MGQAHSVGGGSEHMLLQPMFWASPTWVPPESRNRKQVLSSTRMRKMVSWRHLEPNWLGKWTCVGWGQPGSGLLRVTAKELNQDRSHSTLTPTQLGLVSFNICPNSCLVVQGMWLQLRGSGPQERARETLGLSELLGLVVRIWHALGSSLGSGGCWLRC